MFLVRSVVHYLFKLWHWITTTFLPFHPSCCRWSSKAEYLKMENWSLKGVPNVVTKFNKVKIPTPIQLVSSFEIMYVHKVNINFWPDFAWKEFKKHFSNEIPAARLEIMKIFSFKTSIENGNVFCHFSTMDISVIRVVCRLFFFRVPSLPFLWFSIQHHKNIDWRMRCDVMK